MNSDNTTERRRRRDPVRAELRDLLRRNDLTLAAASLAIGRKKTYPAPVRGPGHPRRLGYRDCEVLAGMLGCGPSELLHEAVPKRKPMKRKPPRMPAAVPGAPLVAVREVTVEVSARAGALAREFVSETALWHWPENMIRHEAGAEPENLRILRVRGNSMEPELRDGDRIVVDVSRRLPATGETFVLWDGIKAWCRSTSIVAHGGRRRERAAQPGGSSPPTRTMLRTPASSRSRTSSARWRG